MMMKVMISTITGKKLQQVLELLVLELLVHMNMKSIMGAQLVLAQLILPSQIHQQIFHSLFQSKKSIVMVSDITRVIPAKRLVGQARRAQASFVMILVIWHPPTQVEQALSQAALTTVTVDSRQLLLVPV